MHLAAQRLASAADLPERSGGKYVGWKHLLDGIMRAPCAAKLGGLDALWKPAGRAIGGQ
jgi:hypothetical protein